MDRRIIHGFVAAAGLGLMPLGIGAVNLRDAIIDKAIAAPTGTASIGPREIMSRLVASGHVDIGPLSLRGDVWLVEATGRDGVRRTLVLTATDGMPVGEGPIRGERRASLPTFEE